MKNDIIKFLTPVAAMSLLLSCTREVDNSYARFPSVIEITATPDQVVLDESAPDDIALTVKWTAAKDYGEDFIMTYKYEWNLLESTSSIKSEYEDMGIFIREYTNAQLQDIMMNDFAFRTSSWGTMQFTVTASYDGAYIVLPDQAKVSVRVKTYGAKQFAADKVYAEGTSLDARIQLEASASNPSLYVWTGNLNAGKINFPVIYGDEENVVVPASGKDVQAGQDPMDAAVQEYSANAPAWVVPTSEPYRVSLNFDTRTVSVIPVSSILEIDRLYLSGTAVGSETEISRTLENDAVFAWKGNLNAGMLSFPVEFAGARDLTLVPSRSESDILDGQKDAFTSASSVSAVGMGWTIPSDGIYRLVLDTEARTLTIYSEATDMKNKTVIFKRTSGVANENCTEEVTKLWIFGANVYYSGSKPKGDPYVLTQSLANPRLFVYKGEALKADNIKFLTSDNWNNEYAFGSGLTKDSVMETSIGAKITPLYAGQGNNRYAWFKISSEVNYIEVFIGDESTDENVNALSTVFIPEGSYVIFDKR